MDAISQQGTYALAIRAVGLVRAAPVVYDLNGASIEIGSAEDNHIVLNGPGVEPYHLTVRQDGSRLYVVIDQAAAKRQSEEVWLQLREDDALYCPRHGRLSHLKEPGQCPLCDGESHPLWLMRPLSAGDRFPVGQVFEASILSQGRPNPGAITMSEIAPTHWPDAAWFEDPPRQPSIRLGAALGEPVEQAYPLTNSNLWVWSPPESPLPVFMHQRVNRYTTRHAMSNLDREVGGLLLGEVYRDPNDGIIYPVITHAVAARFAAEARGHLTFTHDTWLDLNRQREEHYPDKRVVGWYHTHPGLEIFLSQMDLFIHRNFFREPWQVAFVLDPQQDAAGFFVWSGDDLLDPQRPYQLFRIADLEDERPQPPRSRVRIKLGERVS